MSKLSAYLYLAQYGIRQRKIRMAPLQPTRSGAGSRRRFRSAASRLRIDFPLVVCSGTGTIVRLLKGAGTSGYSGGCKLPRRYGSEAASGALSIIDLVN